MNKRSDSMCHQARALARIAPMPFQNSRNVGMTTAGACFLALLFFTQGVAVADWLTFRGDANASGAVAVELPAELGELWTYSAKDGGSEGGFEGTAAIASGIVYVGDFDGTFHAVDLTTGEKKWAKRFEDTGFLAAATIADKHLYLGDYNGIVRCLSTEDGSEAWQYDTKSEVNAAVNVHGEAVLVTTEGGSLLSLDNATGDRRWEYTIDSPLRCWPTVVKDRVLLAGCDGVLHAVDVEKGKQLDTVSIEGPTGCTPAVIKDRAYFGTEDGNFFAVQLDPLKIAWKYRDKKRSSGVRTAAALTKDIVVFGSQGKKVYAINPEKGEPLWEFPTRSRVESSPLIVGKFAFFGTVRGRLYLVDLKSGEEVWQLNTGGSFIASPAVSNGRIVIGNTDGTLYCFGEGGK